MSRRWTGFHGGRRILYQNCADSEEEDLCLYFDINSEYVEKSSSRRNTQQRWADRMRRLMCDDNNWAPLVNLKGRGGSVKAWFVIGRWMASENSRRMTSKPERGWSADSEATLLVPHSWLPQSFERRRIPDSDIPTDSPARSCRRFFSAGRRWPRAGSSLASGGWSCWWVSLTGTRLTD